MSDCYVCGRNSADQLPVRDRIAVTEHWRVAHAFDSELPGWLVIVARSHVAAIDELPAAAWADLGTLIGSLSTALRRATGCAKTYVMQYSEAEGFGHLHFHVVPRKAGQPRERKGPLVFGYLGAEPARRVPDQEMDRIAIEIQKHLATP